MSKRSFLKLSLVLASAVATFRVTSLILGYALWQFPGYQTLLPVQVFLHRWDVLIAPIVAVSAAVLFSRWLERRLAPANARITAAVTLSFALIALCPITVRFETRPVMVSPVVVAIQNDFSPETIEAILDRYPHLVNVSKGDWGQIQPLVEAAMGRRTNLVEVLIRKGANVDLAITELVSAGDDEALQLVLGTAKLQQQR